MDRRQHVKGDRVCGVAPSPYSRRKWEPESFWFGMDLATRFALSLVVAVASFVAMVVCAAERLVWEAVACALVCVASLGIAWYLVPLDD